MVKERKNVYDAVIGPTLLAKYGGEIDACNGVNYDAIQSERFFDNIESECNSLFMALKETDGSILNKMLMCLKVFLIKNPFLFYQTSWCIILYVFNKHFTMAVSYQYFSYLVLHIFPKGYFTYHERCLVSHQHLRAFGLSASDLCPDLLSSLSVVLKQDHLSEKEVGTLSYKLKEGDMAVNDVSVINDEKKTVKNRTAFFVLMEKVGEMYLSGMMLSEMEHPNLLPLVDVLMFKGFPFLLKMALKNVTKQ